jgi:hypothetical protein
VAGEQANSTAAPPDSKGKERSKRPAAADEKVLDLGDVDATSPHVYDLFAVVIHRYALG